MARNGDFDAEMVDISGWSYFWRKCAQDPDSRGPMLFGIFLCGAILCAGVAVGTPVVLTSFDDVDQAKEYTNQLKMKQDTIDGYIAKGISPGSARCLVEEDWGAQERLLCKTLNEPKE